MKVSVIIPCYRERDFIGGCLDSVLAFELPPYVTIEVLVADGMSSDGTRDIVAAVAARDPRVRLLDNPGRTAPAALNLAIAQAHGDYILRLDAHPIYPPDYLRKCLETARRTGADNVGGLFLTEARGAGYAAAMVQALTTHWFGVGNAGFRTGVAEGPADTVPYGCFKRTVFDRIGLFDERLRRAQDYELNRRLAAAGGKIWLNPEIQVRYYQQPNLSSFLRKQICHEAPYVAYMWYLAPYTFAVRHAATGVFAAALLVGGVLATVSSVVGATVGAVAVLYLALALVAACTQAARYRRPLHVVCLPVGFFLFHLAHGLGTLWGLGRLATGTAPVQRVSNYAGAGNQAVLPWRGRAVKRAVDVVGAALGLVLFGWLILLGWLVASADTGKNGFFRQVRVGRYGRLFHVVKLRTMRDAAGPATTVTVRGDPRITRVGAFLRRAKLDEVPQLWNVLTGDMSLVGPRPDVPGFADALTGDDRIILSVRPGITGPAALWFRNEEQDLVGQPDPERYNREVIFPEKVRLNRCYVERYSLWQDMKYLWRTLVPPRASTRARACDKKVSRVDTTMHVDLIEPTDRRWRDTLAMIRHDFYHLPEYVSLESSRLGGTAVAAYVEQPGVRLLLPVIRRGIPASDAFDLVSPYGYPSPIAQFEDVALLRSAFSAVVQTLREQGFVSMFVRLHPILELPDDAFAGLGTLIERGQTVSVDLRQDEAEQWHGIRRDHRASLRRSERLGHRAFMDDTGEHFDRFITVYLDNMRRQNAAAEYFYSRDYLLGLWQHLRGHVHLGVVEIDGSIVCAGLFGESNGIIQYHLSGTEEQALKFSPMKTLINHARHWATQRGAAVLHLGGGLGGAQDSLMLFKAGFSDRRHLFKTWQVVLDEQRYAELSAGALRVDRRDTMDNRRRSTGFFPAYRGAGLPSYREDIPFKEVTSDRTAKF